MQRTTATHKPGAFHAPYGDETMRYEVELKYPTNDMALLESKLAGLGASISSAQSEVDVYFAHPSEDYTQTDKALRLRRKGDSYTITYKGPKIDSATKTRREIDLPLAVNDDNSFEAWFALLEALGFRPAGEVRKSRRKARLDWQGANVEVSLDKVERLGEFVELELVVDDIAQSLEDARDGILSLADKLGLKQSERRSYLELLANAAV